MRCLLTVWHSGSIGPVGLSHLAAAICLACSLAAWALRRYGAEQAGLAEPSRREPGADKRRPSVARVAVALGWISLFTGVLVGLGLCYPLVAWFVRACGQTRGSVPAVTSAAGGAVGDLADWIVVLAATVAGLAGPAGRRLVTPLFWLLTIGIVRMAWEIWPAQLDLREAQVWCRLACLAGSGVSVPLILALTSTSAGFTVAQGLIRQHRRKTAWPDRLWQLTEPHPEWPGFRASAGAAGLAVLLLGCLRMDSPLTVGCAALAAGCLLRLAHRRWNEYLAELGMALATLAVCAAVVLAAPLGEHGPARFPKMLNALLAGLACMTFIWHWLAVVWDQQLLDGQAWTTAGRMIPAAKRVGLAVGALGVLVAVELALWPLSPASAGRSQTASGWLAGLAGNAALLAALAWSARKTAGAVRRGLLGLAGLAVGLFVAVRCGLVAG